MKKLLAIFVLSGMMLMSCNSAGEGSSEPTPYPEQVSWELAIEILNSGKVEGVFQLHNLEVTLVLLDGSSTKTIEPTIDAIFDEVEKCGQTCDNIMLATE